MLPRNGLEQIPDFVDLQDSQPNFFAPLNLRAEERAATSFPAESPLIRTWTAYSTLLSTLVTTDECKPTMDSGLEQV